MRRRFMRVSLKRLPDDSYGRVVGSVIEQSGRPGNGSGSRAVNACGGLHITDVENSLR